MGAFAASLAIGVLQTLAVASDASLWSAMQLVGVNLSPRTFAAGLLQLKLSQLAPVLPYLLLVLVLVFRPRGLLGTRES